MTEERIELIKEALDMHNMMVVEGFMPEARTNEFAKLLIANGAIAASIDGEGFLKIILPENLH